MSIRLRIAPIGLRAANSYVGDVHRHHGPVRGHKLSLSVVDEQGAIRGVAILGRPTSRTLDGENYIEVTRLATDGTPNVCSMLYGRARRVALDLGYAKDHIVTYTLESESGASLRASGWTDDGLAGGGTWSRQGRARTDSHPIERKRRWLAGPTTQKVTA